MKSYDAPAPLVQFVGGPSHPVPQGYREVIAGSCVIFEKIQPSPPRYPKAATARAAAPTPARRFPAREYIRKVIAREAMQPDRKAPARPARRLVTTRPADEEAVRLLRDRVGELEQKLQDAPTVAYCGIWKEGTHAKRGSFFTHQGSVWHALNDTHGRPSEAHQDWVLAVKRGRDGRDAR